MKSKSSHTKKAPASDAHRLLWKIGRKISEIRRRRGLTQDEFARKVGVTWRLVARWEGAENMKVLTLHRLSKVLHCEVIDFFKEPNINFPQLPKRPYSKARKR